MELSLPDNVFQAILEWHKDKGVPEIDLMATSANARLPCFYSRLQEPEALAQNALAQDWTQWRIIYLFPPLWLIPLAMQKLETFQGHGILILPWTPAEPWFMKIQRRASLWHPLSFFGIHNFGPASSAPWTVFSF